MHKILREESKRYIQNVVYSGKLSQYTKYTNLLIKESSSVILTQDLLSKIYQVNII